jgi:putative transposase
VRTAIGDLTPTVGVKAACEAFDFPRSSFYRKGFSGVVSPAAAARFVPRALVCSERKVVLSRLHEERFQNSAPAAVYATLLDEGPYHCSIRTMYRMLESEGEVRERRDPLGERRADTAARPSASSKPAAKIPSRRQLPNAVLRIS